jgi:hypothetical protein
MNWLLSLLVPIKPFGLYLEGMAWYGAGVFDVRFGWQKPYLAAVDDPGQVGPLRSDPSHYDEIGRYLWWGV